MSRRRSRSVHPIFAVFMVILVVGVIVKFWWLFLAMGLVWLGVKVAARSWDRTEARRLETAKHHAALVARADLEHAAIMRGDERGVYGRYPPAA